MKSLELAKTEPIAHNGQNASLTLALFTNTTFNVSQQSGWDACYEAFEEVIDKMRCMTFIENTLAGDVAYACSEKDTDEQRHKCVALQSMRDEENKTDIALQNMSPELEKMYKKTVAMFW
jgi:hypothetical protein